MSDARRKAGAIMSDAEEMEKAAWLYAYGTPYVQDQYRSQFDDQRMMDFREGASWQHSRDEAELKELMGKLEVAVGVLNKIPNVHRSHFNVADGTKEPFVISWCNEALSLINSPEGRGEL